MVPTLSHLAGSLSSPVLPPVPRGAAGGGGPLILPALPESPFQPPSQTLSPAQPPSPTLAPSAGLLEAGVGGGGVSCGQTAELTSFMGQSISVLGLALGR